MHGPISGIVEDHGVVVVNEAGRVVFASSLCTKAEAEALALQVGPGSRVVGINDLRWLKNRMVNGE